MKASLLAHRMCFDITGRPEVLQWQEHVVEAPGPGQVRLRHTAVGVNYIDTYHRSGLYPIASFPSGLGIEAAGVVDAVGPEVLAFQVGDRVAYAGGPLGAYSTARLYPAERLVPIPDTISDEQAAAVLLKGMTVEYLIHRCFAVQAGMQVVWQAAAGGVGLLACQWLSSMGVEVIGTVGSQEKAALALEHGCAHTVLYRAEALGQHVAELTQGAGVPVVYDSVGKDTLMTSLECLAPRGLLVSFGNASGPPDPIAPLTLSTQGSLYLTRPTLFDYIATRSQLLASAKAVFDAVESGALRPLIGQRWHLRDAAECHHNLSGRKTIGSTILTVAH